MSRGVVCSVCGVTFNEVCRNDCATRPSWVEGKEGVLLDLHEAMRREAIAQERVAKLFDGE